MLRLRILSSRKRVTASDAPPVPVCREKPSLAEVAGVSNDFPPRCGAISSSRGLSGHAGHASDFVCITDFFDLHDQT